MTDLKKYNQLVENCIKKIGVDPTTCYDKNSNQWFLKKGSADVAIAVRWEEVNKAAYIQILSPVMQIPSSNKESFYKDLLEINLSLYGVAFAMDTKWAYLGMVREAEGIDENEMMNMLQRVGNYADHLDDKLKAKYK